MNRVNINNMRKLHLIRKLIKIINNAEAQPKKNPCYKCNLLKRSKTQIEYDESDDAEYTKSLVIKNIDLFKSSSQYYTK